jgi:hypothetical protein
VGKENAQKIERKPIHLRTQSKRLVRRTLRFSKTEHMHNLVMDSSSTVTSLDGSSEMTSTPWRHLQQMQVIFDEELSQWHYRIPLVPTPIGEII